MLLLTEKTKQIIDKLYQKKDRKKVASLLEKECGNNLAFYEDITPEKAERARFAAMKISEGNISKLRDAIRLAKADWRDLLVSAEFASDLKAHETWADEILKA